MIKKEWRNYQILNTIATGSTAVLYKAIQTSLDRPVVVKRLHSHLTSDLNFTRRFELEAKAAASLDHENIVRIIDSGSSHENYYIVMDYIDGLSLKELLDKRGVLSEELALLIAHEICMGLDHAHQRGIIHRDIKPANIMITNEGQTKITDFGLAKLHQSQTQQTVANTLLGTPLYMSPEQAIGDNIDGRSDLFSLGTICYEMLTGTQPFFGDNYAAVIQNIIHGTIPPPSKIGKDISSEGETIVMKALNREPARRFRTALEMARAIESLLGQGKIISVNDILSGLIDGKEYKDTAAPTGPGKRKNYRIMKFIQAAAAALVVTGMLVFFGLEPERLQILKSRVSALFAPNPTPPSTEYTSTEHEGIMGAAMTMTPLELIIPAPAETGLDATSKNVVSADSLKKGSTQSEADELRTTAGPDSMNAAQAEPEKPKESAFEQKPTPIDNVSTDKEEQIVALGYMEINVEPAAEILIDGSTRLIGNRLGPLDMTAGKHDIICRSDGYRDYRETVIIKKGELSRRRILLQKSTGGLHFNTEPGTQIIIDGAFKGAIPLSRPILLTVGTHKVELRKAGYKRWISEVYIPEGETLWLNIKLIPR